MFFLCSLIWLPSWKKRPQHGSSMLWVCPHPGIKTLALKRGFSHWTCQPWQNLALNCNTGLFRKPQMEPEQPEQKPDKIPGKKEHRKTLLCKESAKKEERVFWVWYVVCTGLQEAVFDGWNRYLHNYTSVTTCCQNHCSSVEHVCLGMMQRCWSTKTVFFVEGAYGRLLEDGNGKRS